MKKRTIYIVGIMIVAMLCLNGCQKQNIRQDSSDVLQSESDDQWNIIKSGNILLSNEHVEFVLDVETTHFTITDKRSGKQYNSYCEAAESIPQQISQRMKSELTVTYYGTEDNPLYMYSTTDSVSPGNYEVKYSEEAIRVYYTLGADSSKFVIPQVFKEKDFETVLDKLDNASKVRRFKRYYELENGVYILSDSVSDVQKQEIADYMTEIEFDYNLYLEQLESIDIEFPEDNSKAGFIVPIEYTLEDEGFSATILTDKIVENSTRFKLQKIDMLEYFVSTEKDEEGYFVVPDGCGAIIDLNEVAHDDFELDYYGGDYSRQSIGQTQIAQGMPLTMFGYCGSNHGVLASIKEGGELATLKIERKGKAVPVDHGSISFEMRAVDVTEVTDNKNVPVYNLYSEMTSIHPQIQFIFLEEQNCTYAHMAQKYRKVLIDNNQLSENSKAKGIFIDYICMVNKNETVLGIPYEKKIVLSTMSQIITSVNKLIESDIGPISVRLLGYSPSGYFNDAYNRFEIDKRVGTVEELEELRNLLKKHGGNLYLDADYTFVNSEHLGDDFNKKDCAAHYLNHEVVAKGQISTVDREIANQSVSSIMVSSSKFRDYANSYIKSIKSSDLDISDIGLSYGLAGKYVGGDYTGKKNLDRSDSINAVVDSAKAAVDEGFLILYEYGNLYCLDSAEAVLNAPSFSSLFDATTYDIPFYQMVVSDSVSYASVAYNQLTNGKEGVLRELEFGSCPYICMITSDDSDLIGTELEGLYYSLAEARLVDEFIEFCGEWQKIFKCTEGTTIIDRYKVAEELYCTEYLNGTAILTNYSNENIQINGITVKPYSYELTQKGWW